MDQYSINIHGNSGAVNISFEELAYKLASGEILIGQLNDFPYKKNIGNLISFQDKFIVNNAYDHISDELKQTRDYKLALDEWIEKYFSEVGAIYNSGVRFIIDAHISFNHKATEGLYVHHYAGTYFKRLSFTAYRTKLTSSDFYFSSIDTIVQNGVWVEYKSDVSNYESVLNDAELRDSAFTFTIDSSNNLVVGCDLRSEPGFESAPDYECILDLKIDAHELSQDDHTNEII